MSMATMCEPRLLLAAQKRADVFVLVLSEAVLVRVLEELFPAISTKSARTSMIWKVIDMQQSLLTLSPAPLANIPKPKLIITNYDSVTNLDRRQNSCHFNECWLPASCQHVFLVRQAFLALDSVMGCTQKDRVGSQLFKWVIGYRVRIQFGFNHSASCFCFRGPGIFTSKAGRIEE